SFKRHCHHGALHSFPTRRSSDLFIACSPIQQTQILTDLDAELARLRDTKADMSKNFFQGMKWLTLTGYYTSAIGATSELHYRVVDRKSTRLNSSHVAIPYAVFCL